MALNTSADTAAASGLPARLAESIAARLAERERSLSPYAARAETSAGRAVFETPSPTRSEFQRDRDRIIHCKAFRRLKHKTQVFAAPLGDHYATRLTHTLEVAQIARTVARALNLNEDLTEAISLGHDLGHAPFGHVGEDELNRLYAGGFYHSRQSLRIVERVEKDGRGLNLMRETRRGILLHSKPRGDFLNGETPERLSLEGQICRVADAVAYLNHDLADAFRAGVLTPDALPPSVSRVLGDTHARRIDALVSDIVAASWSASGADPREPDAPPPDIRMSGGVREAFYALREFMFENVYLPEDETAAGHAARRVIRLLYRHYDANRSLIPPEYARRSESEDLAVVDFVSGMTDRYAMRLAETLRPGISAPLKERHLN